MNGLPHMASALAAAIASGLISAIWQGAVVAACVALCLRFLPGLTAAARSVIWMNVFGVLILLHALPAVSARLTIGHGAALASVPGHPIELDPRWSVVLALVWAMISLARAIQLGVGAVRLRGLSRGAVPVVPDEPIAPLLRPVDAAGRCGRSAELCVSPDVERPSVFGFFRPRILVPPGLLQRLTASELKQVVLHEMEHLRRGDDWSNLLQKLSLVFFPLNPALVWVERRLCAERELACDDRVLQASAGRKAYALCLAHLAEHRMLHRSFQLVLGAWERRPELARRVYRILSQPARSMSRGMAFAASAGLIAASLAGAAALSRSPQLVSFAPRVQSARAMSDFPAASLHPASLRTVGRLETAVAEVPGAVAQSAAAPALIGGTPQLVKAVMPGSAAQAQALHRRVVAKRRLRPQPVQQQATWVVLTGWEDLAQPPQLIFAVAHGNHSYAAVQFANGWLIVQI